MLSWFRQKSRIKELEEENRDLRILNQILFEDLREASTLLDCTLDLVERDNQKSFNKIDSEVVMTIELSFLDLIEPTSESDALIELLNSSGKLLVARKTFNCNKTITSGKYIIVKPIGSFSSGNEEVVLEGISERLRDVMREMRSRKLIDAAFYEDSTSESKEDTEQETLNISLTPRDLHILLNDKKAIVWGDTYEVELNRKNVLKFMRDLLPEYQSTILGKEGNYGYTEGHRKGDTTTNDDEI